MAGRISMFGGTLVLTHEDVAFIPLFRLGPTRRFALAKIDSVSADADRPPRLRITVRNRKSLVLLVLPQRTAPVWSLDNSARDEAVAAINERLPRD
jgi:hypothetical protein